MPGEDRTAPDLIEVEGARLRFRLEGRADAPAVVFANSLCTSLEMWDRQVPALLPDYRVLRFDMRGHGGSETAPPPYSIEALAGDVIGLMDRLGIERAIFVGLSLGGMIGQWLGARAAARFDGLVLCDTAMEMNRSLWDDRIAAVAAGGVGPTVEPSLERWFTPAFATREPAVLDAVRAMMRRTSGEGYQGCAAAIRDMELRALTPTILLPSLVIVGADDPSTPISAAEAIRDAIAGSSLAVIPDGRHLPNIEQPDRFNTLLKGFLTQHAAP